MSSERSQSYCLYVCGIERQVLQIFQDKVSSLVGQVTTIYHRYIGKGKENWRFAEIRVNSQQHLIHLMIGLRGIKLDNSKLGLVVYLPMNIPLATRTAMEKTVKDSLTKLNLNRGGCLYDTEIENMKTVATNLLQTTKKALRNSLTTIKACNIPSNIKQAELLHFFGQAGKVDELSETSSNEKLIGYRKQSDAVIALHCLQNFEIVQGVNISLEIHDSPVVVKVLQKAVNSLSPATNVKHRKAWLHQTQSYRWKKESSSPPNLSNHAISNKINHSNGRPTKSPTSSTNQRKNKSRNYMDQRITTKHGNSNHTNVKKADHANSNGFTNGHSDYDRKLNLEMQHKLAKACNAVNAKLTSSSTAANLEEVPIHSELPSIPTSGEIKLEFNISNEAFFLCRHLELEQSLKDCGYEVDFIYESNQENCRLMVVTQDKYRDHTMKTISSYCHCSRSDARDFLPLPVCSFIAANEENQLLMNKQLQLNKVNAGIVPTADDCQSVDIISLDAPALNKAISMLKYAFKSKSMTIPIEDLFSTSDFDLFSDRLRDRLCENNIVHIHMECSRSFDLFKIVVTGASADLEQVFNIIDSSLGDFKMIEFSIPDIPILQATYLQYHLKANIKRIEEVYYCRIGFKEIDENKTNITIKCCQIDKIKITFDIKKLLDQAVTGRSSANNTPLDLQQRLSYSFGIDQLQNQLQDLSQMTENKLQIGQKLRKPYSRGTMEKNSIQSESASKNVSKATKITAESSLLRSSSNIESAIKAIRLVSGTLENASSKVEVIVNYIKLLHYHQGEIGKMLHRIGGMDYRIDCHNNLQSLTVDQIGTSDGRYFGCKKVYHIPSLSSNKSLSWFINRIDDCLEKANADCLASIAIPMYGIAEFQPQTGTFVKQIVLAACRFYQKHQTGANLKSIHFVIQPNNTECYATFTSTLKDLSPSYAT